MWDTDTLEDMEKTAQHQYDGLRKLREVAMWVGCCNKKINGAWLEVKSLNGFQYYYNNKQITRELAKELMKAR